MFQNEETKEILNRGWDATQQAVIYSIADSMIYGNWLFTVITTVFIPNWLCFWVVAMSNIQKEEATDGKEKKD